MLHREVPDLDCVLGSGHESSKEEFELKRRLGCSAQTGVYGLNVPTKKSCHGFTLIVRCQESDNIRVGP